jgi:PAS domain S-box-containing protein
MTDPDKLNEHKSDWKRLREQALTRIKKRMPDLFELKAEESAKLLYELEVHQAELEVQNDELRGSQDELVEAHERYRSLFEIAPVSYLTVDAKGVVQECNLMASRLFGKERSKIIGNRIEMFVVPEDRDDCFKAIRQTVLQGTTQRRELRFLGPEESIFYGIMDVSTIGDDSSSKRDSFRIAITNITRRKEVENDLRLSLDRMAWVLDKTGVGMWLNQLPLDHLNWDGQTKRLFFIPPDTDPTIELFYSRLHPDDREPTRLAMEKALHNRTLYSIDHRAVNPDTGAIRWIRSIGQASYADNGTLARFDGINFDISWRKQAEEALRQLNETLEQRVSERTAVINAQSEKLRSLAEQLSLTEQKERKRLAQILHDHIQQLIVAARMQSEWIRHTSKPEQMKEAAQTATAILDEALEASRSLAVDLSPPVLHELGLIGALRWLAERMKEQHHFSVQVHARSEAEPFAEDIRFLLFDCARELLLNAVKHSGAGEAKAELSRTNHGNIRLSISDEGKGFDATLMEERYPQENTFGLFSVQQRLWQIGGRMEIITAPGKGTKIVALVPDVANQSSVSRQEENEEKAERVEQIGTSGRSDVCRVLIVDDHEVVREGLSRLLRMAADIELVGKAADGRQAIELANALDPDVILMDVSLGEMNGAEATRRILAEHPNIRVIGLSVRDDQGVIDMMRDAGAAAYLTKSAHSKEILDTIRNCYNN